MRFLFLYNVLHPEIFKLHVLITVITLITLQRRVKGLEIGEKTIMEDFQIVLSNLTLAI
jgi:hypothetical protein